MATVLPPVLLFVRDLRAALAVFCEWQHDKTYSGGAPLSEKEAQAELNVLLSDIKARYPGFVFPFRHGGQ
jgi:hypothetical protein